jgi:hypothetical protein
MKTKITEHNDSNGSRAAAILQIHDAPNMTRQGRTRIANWLRHQARFLETNGPQFAKRFKARWLYTPRKP